VKQKPFLVAALVLGMNQITNYLINITTHFAKGSMRRRPLVAEKEENISINKDIKYDLLRFVFVKVTVEPKDVHIIWLL
jgi:hypothetical protein